MSVEEDIGTLDKDGWEWSVEDEIKLLYAMDGLKPIGLHKNFYMMCIKERLASSLNRYVSSESIWTHLRTLFNLEILDKTENMPIINNSQEFSLPESEFGSIILTKFGESDENLNTDSSTMGSASAIMDNKEKTPSSIKVVSAQLQSKENPKRSVKRTRGSTSVESSSPSTTPPPMPSKRRRI